MSTRRSSRYTPHGVCTRSLTSRSRVPLRRWLAASLVAGACVVVSACGSSSTSGGTASAATHAPLVIGMSLPLTGPVADVSKSGYEGYRLWAARVNAAGGLLGRKVKLNVLDDGFDPNQDASNYLRLITQQKVDLLLGTFSSLLNAPASAVAARQRMLYIEPSGGSTSLFTRGFKNLFFAQPGTTATEPDRFVQWITSLPASSRPKTAAYITADDPSASPVIAAFKPRLQALGIKSVYDKTYDPNTSNFDTEASAIAQAKPDLVIQGAVASDGAQLVQSLQKLSFSPKTLFQTNAPADATYASAIGGAHNADGVFTAEAWSPDARYPGNAAFVSAYTKMFGHPPSEDAANSYTAGQVLAAAVKAVGRIDQQALQTWLHSHTVSTIVGPLRWNAAGDPEGSLLLGQWQHGALRIVAPASVATSHSVINPKPTWAP
jgi:branched-chain amino acid transport system substrate-binding protein